MPVLIALNKPYGVLSQFTPEGRWRSLAEFVAMKGVYCAGRLDADSEGLLLLTDDGGLQARIADPRHKLPKEYWAQVEGIPRGDALDPLRRGVVLKDFRTLPAGADCVDEPAWLWPRDPPIRYRRDKPTAWIRLEIAEGKNRQVRRMCAAIGYPVLRLIRRRIGALDIDGLPVGQCRCFEADRETIYRQIVGGKK